MAGHADNGPVLDLESLCVFRAFNFRADVLRSIAEPVEDLSCLAAGGVSGAGRGSRNFAFPGPSIVCARLLELLTVVATTLGVWFSGWALLTDAAL